MKKIIVLLLVVTGFVTANAQSFMGVKPEGFASVVVGQLYQKGFRQVFKNQDGYTLKGWANGEAVEVTVDQTPISKKCWRIRVWMPELTSWEPLKENYFKYQKIFLQRYGTTESVYAFFKDPYNEGDGDEMEGVEEDMCYFGTFWDKPTMTLSVRISEFAQVVMAYENKAMVKLAKSEREKLISQTF